MIFYFSGTGNSKGIAGILAERLSDQSVDIIGADPKSYSFKPDELLGFVFPVYAWAAPEVMLQFIKKLNPGDAYTFAIATYSNVAGLALTQFSEILPLKSGYGITMPDNFPVLDRVLETEDSAKQKLQQAATRLEYIITRLQRRAEEFDVKTGDDAEHRTYILSKLFNEQQRKTRPYSADAAQCTGCGFCEQICPAHAIRMHDAVPKWIQDDCYLCMACLNRCPATAIEYGEYSKGRFRYEFRGFDTSKYFC